MPYYLEKFDDLDLPRADTQTQEGAAGTSGLFMPTASGKTFDAYGDDRADVSWPVEEPWSALIVGASATAVETLLAALRAKIRKVGKLFRTDFAGTSQWCTARLMQIGAPRTADVVTQIAVSLTWLRLSEWHGERHSAGWLLDDGWYFDDGLYLDEADVVTLIPATAVSITLKNDGSADVTDCIITITAGSAAITNLVIANTTTGMSLTFSGTIAAGTALVIDRGAASVLNNAVDAYADLTVAATADDSDDWLRLPADTDSVVTVTATGGGADSTADFLYYENWE